MTVHGADSDSSALCLSAVTAALNGWRVFPVTPGGKRPAIKAWEGRARLDPEAIRACWTADATWNVGIATGPSGLVVVDLDMPKSSDDAAPAPWNQLGIASGADVLAAVAEQAREPWPHTYTVTTPSGGLHLYFSAPRGREFRNTQGKLGWKIDTRAGGGYVLAAGSVIGTTSYVVLDDRDPIELPDWIASRLATQPAQPRSRPELPVASRHRMSAYVQAAVTNETDRVRTAGKGKHNRSLYVASVALGQLAAGRLLATADAHRELRAAAELHIAGPCGCTATDVEATIASGLKTGARRPRTAAA